MKRIPAILLIALLASPAFAGGRFLGLPGDDPVDVNCAQRTLPKDHCIVANPADTEHPITVRGGSGRFSSGRVREGELVHVDEHGRAVYMVACCNVVTSEWSPGPRCGDDRRASIAAALGKIVGEKGDKGDKGDRGDPGPKGDKGDPGQSYDTEIYYGHGQSWASRHPVWTGIIVGAGAFILGAAACHNTILGICGDPERQNSAGGDTPPESAQCLWGCNAR